MKKIIGLALSLVLSLSLVLAGCSGSGDEATTSGSETTKAGGIAKEDIKVGVIHISDPAEGSGYTFTHDQGIVAMQQNLGLEDSQIIRKNNISDSDPTAIETAMRECIEDGCNIIFATSWGYMDTCEALAEEFPDVYFAHGSGYKSNGQNFINYFGRIYQARYLAGIVAGLKTESDKVGFVAAMDKENSEVTGGLDAFAMGVYSVNPEAQVFVKVTNSWYDPEAETSAAKALIAEGCDVIGQHCDTPNPQLAAEEAGVWGVGYNSNMSKDAPDATLTSVVWDWGVYYTAAVQSLIDGTWDGSNYYGGMKEGLVGITDLSAFCADGTAEAVDQAKASILDGSFNVFDGVIETNEGTTVGKEGSTLSDAEITGGINWYFKNIVVK
ncbi:BMP family ABC transporter substrate-binding protein [Parasporobacterium paucivorans]|uniref:Nucleoside-binding protein n=1 Tax=Parasporobacterium paucivorans DSM 15970 TaxID=1122934 RepID=A0A1M6C7R8_9FIRM|nr:BMP family ABC transporter substrate-binding protein [Parasporobacterium paucivorans]SHI57046.1 nucleoside-binding protein [Parasporobacterium paucivorans DSM 15970]